MRGSGMTRGFALTAAVFACLMMAVPAMAYTPYAPVANPDGALPTQVARVLAADNAAGDEFGVSVSVDGDTMVVGAYKDDIGGDVDRGSAYVFTRSGASWIQQATLKASDGVADDRFGRSVAISGDTIVVGCERDNVGAHLDQGSVYVFTRTGTEWTQQQRLIDADGEAGAALGVSVDILGDTLIAGAPGANVGGSVNRGAAYVFTRSGTIWTLQQELDASDGGANDNAGVSVAVYGDYAAVGAPSANVGGSADQGAAYVFARTGTAWTQQSKLLDPDGVAQDWLGQSIALTGDTVLVGANGDDVGANPDQGSALVFTRSGTTWTHQAKLVGAEGGPVDRAGTSVALVGKTAVVGAFGTDFAGRSDQGAAYLFTRTGTTWTQQARLLDSAGEAGGNFAASVALSGATVVVGGNGVGASRGAAYVYAPYTTLEGTPLTISPPGVLANDTDANVEPITAVKLTDPAHGSVNMFDNGAFIYTPADGFSGTDAFTYRAFDGGLYSAPATVTITVTAVNVAPVSAPDAYSGGQDATLTVSAPGLLANDTDADSDPLTAVKVTDPAHGTVTVAADGSFSYRPAAGFHGTDSFTYSASDGIATSTPSTVTITVVAPPVAVADMYSTREDFALSVAAPGVLANDTDADSHSLTATLSTNPSHGALTLSTNGAFSYTPASGYSGTDSFTYRASDGVGYSVPATVTITVVAAPDATTLTLSAPTVAPAYGSAPLLTATLIGPGATPLSGQTIMFEQLVDSNWVTLGAELTDGEGLARIDTGALTTKQTYRARFAASSTYLSSMSGEVDVKPKAYVAKPIAPSTASRTKSFTVKGNLKPRHTAGTYAVRIYKWRRTASGTYKAYGYVRAKVANYSTYSRYSVKLKLTTKGKWRLRAYAVVDDDHAEAWSSGYDYVTVK